MKHCTAAAIIAALTLPGCASAIKGGPPLNLSPDLSVGAHIGSISLSTGWIDVAEDFSDTFAAEVGEELSACATGPRRLDLRVHIDDVHRADRLEAALAGDAVHAMAATAEIVDPDDRNRIVGRYPVAVETPAGGPVEALLADRQMMVAEAWGRALCTEAFGRNPRHPGPHNATQD